MTVEIAVAAKKSALPTTTITAINPEGGPPSIQGREDGEACLPGLFDLFEKHVTASSGYNAVIIACFDDTMLDNRGVFILLIWFGQYFVLVSAHML